MSYHFLLIMLFLTQLPLTQSVVVESPAEWPVSVGYSVTPSTVTTGMLDVALSISNDADSPIVTLVFDKLKPVGPDGTMVTTGESGTFFVERVSGKQEFFPIDPGTARTISVSLSSDIHQVLRLKSVLFADGTSLGQREPYAYRYVNEVTRRVVEVSEKALAIEQSPQKVQLLEGLIATLRQRATAFSAVSQGAIENRVPVP
jgi:hypothetical protein